MTHALIPVLTSALLLASVSASAAVIPRSEETRPTTILPVRIAQPPFANPETDPFGGERSGTEAVVAGVPGPGACFFGWSWSMGYFTFCP